MKGGTIMNLMNPCNIICSVVALSEKSANNALASARALQAQTEKVLEVLPPFCFFWPWAGSLPSYGMLFSSIKSDMQKTVRKHSEAPDFATSKAKKPKGDSNGK